MPRRKIRVADDTRDLIRGLHPVLKRKVRLALEDILGDPHSGKALQAELSGLWSFRIGKLRIIYRWDKSAVEIVAVGHRRIVYQETMRLIQKVKGQ